MKLLITTQAIDRNDPVLGFFHRWAEEFAKHFEHIYIICLKQGEFTLPKNVTVYSLGKEGGESQLKYMYRFYTHIWKLRGAYDAIFSHMNPHYILLAGLYWKYTGKKIFFWRNHAKMNWMTRIVAPCAEHVFHTSPHACTAKYAHAVQMPVGIDTNLFSFEPRALIGAKKILSIGRISPVKKLEILLSAIEFLPKEYELHLYGDAPSHDEKYLEALKKEAQSNVYFHGSIENYRTPEIFKSHHVFVNLTPAGSMDKTVLEAVACGTPTIVANDSFLDTLNERSYIGDVSPQSVAERITEFLTMDESVSLQLREDARKKVVEKHSLEKLASLLSSYIHGKN